MFTDTDRRWNPRALREFNIRIFLVLVVLGVYILCFGTLEPINKYGYGIDWPFLRGVSSFFRGCVLFYCALVGVSLAEASFVIDARDSCTRSAVQGVFGILGAMHIALPFILYFTMVLYAFVLRCSAGV